MNKKILFFLKSFIFTFFLGSIIFILVSCGSNSNSNTLNGNSIDLKSYTITWKNDDGTILEYDSNVLENTMPSYDGSTPTKASDKVYKYTFAGWDKPLTKTTENKTYTATYYKEYIDYTVIFYDDDGVTVIDKQIYHYGDTITNTPTPTKLSTTEYSYIFAGWDKNLTTVEGNTSYTATYIKSKNSYKVTFVDYDGTVISTSILEYGQTPIIPSDPFREEDEFGSYVFKEWSPKVDKVTSDVVYYATYEINRKYLLNIICNDGNEIKVSLFHNDDILDNVNNITRDGYTFGGFFTDEKLTNEITTMPSSDITVYVWWKEETKPSNFNYRDWKNGVKINGYFGNENSVVIPSYIGNKPVKSLFYAFDNNINLVKLIIPDTVIEISSLSLMNNDFSSLEELTLPFFGDNENECSYLGYLFGAHDYFNNSSYVPKSLKKITITKAISISKNAFYDCTSLKSITIGNSVTTIEDYAFYGCTNLRNVTIGNGVTTIGKSAFNNCYSLTGIVIPNSVTSIGDFAFLECRSLIEVINKSSLTITKGDTSNGYVGYYALNVKTSGTSDIVNKDGYLFYTYNETNYLIKYIGNDNDLVLPSDYNGKTYEIYEYAFHHNTEITSVVVPDCLTSISDYAFSGCINLTSAIIGDKVTTIGMWSFGYCRNLVTVKIGCSVTEIKNYAFEHCDALIEVINNSTLEIKRYSHDYGNVSYNANNIIINGESEIIKDGEFLSYNGCLIKYVGYNTNVIIPDYCNSIRKDAFINIDNTFTSLTINNKSLALSNDFSGWNIETLIFGDNVTSIGNGVFKDCTNLKNVIISDNVIYIDDYAFENCTNLSNIDFGNNVSSISENAFDGCTSLQYNEYDNAYYLGNEDNPYAVLVKAKSTDITSCEINKNCKIINQAAFYYCNNLKYIVLPLSVTAISNSAFIHCDNLENIFYLGTSKQDLDKINFNSNFSADILSGAKINLYSETSYGGYDYYHWNLLFHWHYVDGVPTVW